MFFFIFFSVSIYIYAYIHTHNTGTYRLKIDHQSNYPAIPDTSNRGILTLNQGILIEDTYIIRNTTYRTHDGIRVCVAVRDCCSRDDVHHTITYAQALYRLGFIHGNHTRSLIPYRSLSQNIPYKIRGSIVCFNIAYARPDRRVATGMLVRRKNQPKIGYGSSKRTVRSQRSRVGSTVL